MKSIIRIEHPSDGIGIFTTRNKGERMWKYTSEDHKTNPVCIFDYSPSSIGEFVFRHRDFPMAEIDCEGFIIDEHYCAYISVEQVQQWIMPEELNQLIDLGFRIYILDISQWIEGKYQIAYKKEHILQQKDITSLFQTNNK